MSALGRLLQDDQLFVSLPALSLFDALLFVCFCALAVHKVYNEFEVDPVNFFATFVLLGIIPAFPIPFVARHAGSLMSGALFTYLLFYSVLGLSIILYRVSPFHPLAKYPGPLLLKISKFAAMWHVYGGKQFIHFKALHDKYGPCVRIGPNELSIVDIDAISPVLGVDGMRKGPEYDAHNLPNTIPSIVPLRDVDAHRVRRKLWNHGFTTSALKDYQPMVAARVLQLAEALSKRAVRGSGGSKSVDVAQWVKFFTYDFMGDLVFDGGFELMRDGDNKDFVHTLEQTMRFIGILEHIPWITQLLHRISATAEEHAKFVDFGKKRVAERREKGSARKDLFHFISNEDRLEDIEVPEDQYTNDTFTAIIAGADTTSTVLGGIFYYLLTHRDVYERLRAEVDAMFPLGEGDPFDSIKLAAMPYLNAIINEVLRLQPAVPSSLQRSPLIGSGGKWVANRFIPENTAVYIPPYVLHRDTRYFSPSPDSFIPERWFGVNSSSTRNSSDKFTINTAAFIPFSFGPANCAGKNLALLEMRMVVATLVQRFNMRLAEGYDPHKWMEELQDYFVMKSGKLPVVLTARE